MFIRKKDKIEIVEKNKEEISIRSVSETVRPLIDLTEVDKRSFLTYLKKKKRLVYSLIFCLGSVLIIALLLQGGCTKKKPVIFKYHAIIDDELKKSFLVEEYLYHLLKQKEKAGQLAQAAHKLGVTTFPQHTKLLLYYERISDPRPYKVRLFTEPQTSIIFDFEGEGRVERLSNRLIRTYLVERYVLDADMLDLITTKEKSEQPRPHWELLAPTEEILSWSIGLRNLQKYDTIYWIWQAQKYEDDPDFQRGSMVGIKLSARSLDTAIYAFRLHGERDKVFYDYEGRPMERQFLQSPVNYGRISSRYNLLRLNPVLKRIKAHFGTDFAAPEGSEIYALADGVIVKRQSDNANGNYVKIQHDSIYATGYLHLSRFEERVQLNDTVHQGQVIGYVGQTGQATGPHVCLRFWRREFKDDFVEAFPYLPKPPVLPFAQRQEFFQVRDSILTAIRSFDH